MVDYDSADICRLPDFESDLISVSGTIHLPNAKDLAVDWGKSVAVTGGWDANLIVWNLGYRPESVVKSQEAG